MPAEQTIRINTLAISYYDAGPTDAPTILFIHGFPFNKQMWRDQIDALQTEFRIIAYDVRGHGQSDRGTDAFSIDLFVTDLINLLDALQIEQAIVCGLSMGGYIALRALQQHPHRFRALILCDTQCMADTPEGKAKRMKAIESINTQGVPLYAKASIINLFAAESFQNKQQIITDIQQTIEQTSPDTICKTLIALAQRSETCSRLNEINIPTLILVGQEDKITPVATARFMHEKIKHATLSIIEHAGHVSNLENPVDFNFQLRQFVLPFLKTN